MALILLLARQDTISPSISPSASMAATWPSSVYKINLIYSFASWLPDDRPQKMDVGNLNVYCPDCHASKIHP